MKPATNEEIEKWKDEVWRSKEIRKAGGTPNPKTAHEPFIRGLIARIAELEALVRHAMTNSFVTTADDPGCFFCDHVAHTPECSALRLLPDD